MHIRGILNYLPPRFIENTDVTTVIGEYISNHCDSWVNWLRHMVTHWIDWYHIHLETKDTFLPNRWCKVATVFYFNYCIN